MLQGIHICTILASTTSLPAEEATIREPVTNGPSNERIIRYSDVLLLYAEAAYHTGRKHWLETWSTKCVSVLVVAMKHCCPM